MASRFFSGLWFCLILSSFPESIPVVGNGILDSTQVPHIQTSDFQIERENESVQTNKNLEILSLNNDTTESNPEINFQHPWALKPVSSSSLSQRMRDPGVSTSSSNEPISSETLNRKYHDGVIRSSYARGESSSSDVEQQDLSSPSKRTNDWWGLDLIRIFILPIPIIDYVDLKSKPKEQETQVPFPANGNQGNRNRRETDVVFIPIHNSSLEPVLILEEEEEQSRTTESSTTETELIMEQRKRRSADELTMTSDSPNNNEEDASVSFSPLPATLHQNVSGELDEGEGPYRPFIRQIGVDTALFPQSRNALLASANRGDDEVPTPLTGSHFESNPILPSSSTKYSSSNSLDFFYRTHHDGSRRLSNEDSEEEMENGGPDVNSGERGSLDTRPRIPIFLLFLISSYPKGLNPTLQNPTSNSTGALETTPLENKTRPEKLLMRSKRNSAEKNSTSQILSLNSSDSNSSTNGLLQQCIYNGFPPYFVSVLNSTISNATEINTSNNTNAEADTRNISIPIAANMNTSGISNSNNNTNDSDSLQNNTEASISPMTPTDSQTLMTPNTTAEAISSNSSIEIVSPKTAENTYEIHSPDNLINSSSNIKNSSDLLDSSTIGPTVSAEHCTNSTNVNESEWLQPMTSPENLSSMNSSQQKTSANEMGQGIGKIADSKSNSTSASNITQTTENTTSKTSVEITTDSSNNTQPNSNISVLENSISSNHASNSAFINSTEIPTVVVSLKNDSIGTNTSMMNPSLNSLEELKNSTVSESTVNESKSDVTTAVPKLNKNLIPISVVNPSTETADSSDMYTGDDNAEIAYTVSDSPAHLFYSFQETLKGNTSTGSYRILLPDGRTEIVKFTADASGYHPVIEYKNSNTQSNAAGGR